MFKSIVFTTIFLLTTSIFVYGQKTYKTPTHSLGLEISQSVMNFKGFSSNNVTYGDPIRYKRGFGGSVAVLYQYAPKSSFVGFQSGLGIYMWGLTNLNPINNTNVELDESFYLLGIPLIFQFKLSKKFWLEGGLQVNLPVYNTLKFAGGWQANKSLYEAPPGSFPNMELQSVFGFRYHIFQSLAFKFRFHYGLTPSYFYDIPSHNSSVFSPEERRFRYRLTGFELGLAYLFPLKK
ncbi:MAG: outer membrane beta-barrel protein [Cryomorphaceae bacterium]|nr:outer membrane beta-barrel protein [Cryomorphaceae bacterium]